MDREEIEDMLETMLIGDSDQGKLRQLLIEHEQEMQRLRNENERLKILADCEKKHVDTKQKCVIDMTRPQPCTKFMDEPPMLWAAKLTEEVSEAFRASVQLGILYDAFDVAINNVDEKAVRFAENLMAEELTDVITVCTSWLASLGYDEAERGRIQRAVNDKNHRRGYWV